MDRGAWRATVHRVAKSQTQFSIHACTHMLFFFASTGSLASQRHPGKFPQPPEEVEGNVGKDSLSLLQQIFPTQESNQVSYIAGRFFTK